MSFFVWVLENECFFNKHEKKHLFKPFLQKVTGNFDLLSIENSETAIYNYLWVNGYPEDVLLSFLWLWTIFEKITQK